MAGVLSQGASVGESWNKTKESYLMESMGAMDGCDADE